MPDRINRLKIEGFRGATQPLDLEFDTSKPVVLIFGENGSGKSTIVDAIESVGAGTTAFLNDWKLGQGKRKEGYIPAFGKQPADVAISMGFGANTYTARLNNRGIQLCNTQDRPVTKVLRRKSLQAFMDADPAQRYREVAAFLDIPQIEAAEASLREALKNAQRQYELATSAYSQAQESLHGLWEAEGSPGLEDKHDAESWARQQAVIPTEQLQDKLASLKASVKHCENLNTQTETVASAEQQLTQAQENLAAAEKQVAAVESGDGEGSAELVTLLQDAETYLTKTPDKLCPVCEETAIDASELVQRLQQRIAGMRALKQASDAKNAAGKTVHTRQEQLDQVRKRLLDMAQAAQRHFYPELPDEETIEQFRQADQEKALLQAGQLQTDLAARLEALKTNLDATQKQLHNLTSIRQSVKILDEKSVEAKARETLSKRLQKAVNIFEAKRKNYVEGVLADIATDVDSLYQRIHPHEDIGQIRLNLDDNKRGSLVYGVAFGGKQGIHPQPYYSESHLDTLGLCIFLALAKRGDSSRTLIVLDDVLGSVDQPHLQKTLDMLMQEADAFAQVIITTHYRPLRNRFMHSRTGTSKVQVIDLKPWRIRDGVRFATPKLAYDELQQLMANDQASRSDIAITAGRFLENCFDHFTLLYGLRMMRKPEPAYTLNELYSAVRGIKAWKIINASGETEIKPILEKLHELLPVRNQVGAHYNENGDLLSDDEITEFGDTTLQLASAVICPNCSGMPERLDNALGKWVCSCKQTQMLPLK